MWWRGSHMVERQPYGGGSHMVDRQSRGGQAATWWTGSHVVDRQPRGGTGRLQKRVRKLNVLKRDMPKFKPASEKKEIVTPI